MQDEQIAMQIVRALEKSRERAEGYGKLEGDALQEAMAAEYLSGANQIANYLTRKEGEVTSQQVERVLEIVGKRLGFVKGNP